ncbi:MAG: peptidase S11 [Sphingobacteriia bacterium]|nr:peptidase S11 [Sphingobacteriia bacterium]NCC40417.1 peptidase S11 [Gammaproteobacteria bacterium]
MPSFHLHPLPSQPSSPLSITCKDLLRGLLWILLIIALFLSSNSVAAASTASAKAEAVSQTAPQIRSASALIMDERGHRLYAKNTQEIKPIASITKLMTAMVVLDAGVALDEPISIEDADRDRLRHSRSRLRIGQATLSRRELLMVALMSSDNRAAAALGRTTFAEGTPRFIAAMNQKAALLGLRDTRFVDSSGLDDRNRSTAEDLIRLIQAASAYPLIREATASGELSVHPHADGTPLEYRNTNPLVRNPSWSVTLSKTGYINESGHCLVMITEIAGRRLFVVLLDAVGKLTPVGDSNRMRNWLLDEQRLVRN